MKDILDREILLNIKFDRIYYSPQHFVLLSDTNFPFADCSFYQRINLYWLVKIINYDIHDNDMVVEIKDYDNKNITKFNDQKSKGLLKRITFIGLKFKPIEKFMWSYKPILFEDARQELESQSKSIFERVYEPIRIKPQHIEQKYESQLEELKIEYPISQIICLDGAIAVSITPQMVSGLEYAKSVQIRHEVMKREFQVLLKYFAKSSNKNRLKIVLHIKYQNKRVKEITASSDDLTILTLDVVERANILYSRDKIIKKNKVETINQIDSIISIDNKIGLTKIIAGILNCENSLHEKEIRYLTNKLYFLPDIKLKVVYKPDLAFLFLVLGAKKIHFILETYKADHATYIWSFDHSSLPYGDKEFMLNSYSSVEKEINSIIINNRINYRKNYTSKNFKLLEHDNSVDGFNRWQQKLSVIIND